MMSTTGIKVISPGSYDNIILDLSIFSPHTQHFCGTPKVVIIKFNLLPRTFPRCSNNSDNICLQIQKRNSNLLPSRRTESGHQREVVPRQLRLLYNSAEFQILLNLRVAELPSHEYLARDKFQGVTTINADLTVLSLSGEERRDQFLVVSRYKKRDARIDHPKRAYTQRYSMLSSVASLSRKLKR